MQKLFLIYLGGNLPGFSIELHEIRFGIGNKIEDTFDNLSDTQLSQFNRLHIDGYLIITKVDGYKVSISKKIQLDERDGYRLWLIHLGGYIENNIVETHEIVIVIAKTLKEAKSKAKYKSKLIQNGLHIDDIIIINNEYLNNNIKYKSKDKLYISLEKDDSILDQDVVKQWNGYLRIHK